MDIEEIKNLKEGTMLRHKSTGCVLPFYGVPKSNRVMLSCPDLYKFHESLGRTALIRWSAEECELAEIEKKEK